MRRQLQGARAAYREALALHQDQYQRDKNPEDLLQQVWLLALLGRGATLTITAAPATLNGNRYRAVATNSQGSATSNAATLTVSPLITPSGQISYAGGAYLQSFDTLPNTGTFTLPGNGPFALSAPPISASNLGGWSLAKYDGTGTVALLRVDAGTSTSGSIYSYGTGTSTDRALGSLSSGTTIPRFGVTLVNNTGQTITQFTLSYTGEQWRRGSAAARQASGARA